MIADENVPNWLLPQEYSTNGKYIKISEACYAMYKIFKEDPRIPSIVFTISKDNSELVPDFTLTGKTFNQLRVLLPDDDVLIIIMRYYLPEAETKICREYYLKNIPSGKDEGYFDLSKTGPLEYDIFTIWTPYDERPIVHRRMTYRKILVGTLIAQLRQGFNSRGETSFDFQCSRRDELWEDVMLRRCYDYNRNKKCNNTYYDVAKVQKERAEFLDQCDHLGNKYISVEKLRKLFVDPEINFDEAVSVQNEIKNLARNESLNCKINAFIDHIDNWRKMLVDAKKLTDLGEKANIIYTVMDFANNFNPKQK